MVWISEAGAYFFLEQTVDSCSLSVMFISGDYKEAETDTCVHSYNAYSWKRERQKVLW